MWNRGCLLMTWFSTSVLRMLKQVLLLIESARATSETLAPSSVSPRYSIIRTARATAGASGLVRGRGSVASCDAGSVVDMRKGECIPHSPARPPDQHRSAGRDRSDRPEYQPRSRAAHFRKPADENSAEGGRPLIEDLVEREDTATHLRHGRELQDSLDRGGEKHARRSDESHCDEGKIKARGQCGYPERGAECDRCDRGCADGDSGPHPGHDRAYQRTRGEEVHQERIGRRVA